MLIKIVKDKRMDKLKHLYALHKLAKEARRKINEERDGFTIVSGSFKLTFAVEQYADIVEEIVQDPVNHDGYTSKHPGTPATCKRQRCYESNLLKKLKIAEDALKRIDNMCDGDMCKFFENTRHCSACRYLNGCQTGVAHAALAAIRGKGGEDDK